MFGAKNGQYVILRFTSISIHNYAVIFIQYQNVNKGGFIHCALLKRKVGSVIFLITVFLCTQ